MAIKVSSREVKNSYPFVIQIGYCDLYYPLVYQRKIGYTSGIYGWNSDVYFIEDVAISTGYRPFGRVPDRDLVKHYNELGRKVYENRDISFDTKVRKLSEILMQFISDCKEEWSR